MTDSFNLRAFRKRNALTQTDVAEHLGVSKGFISQIEQGKVALPEDKYYKLISNPYGWKFDAMAEAVADVPVKIPIVPFAVRGGALQGFSDGVEEWECERIISPVKGAEMAMEVVGDSMAPGYPAGTRVLLKQVKATIAWNEVYVIDSVDGPVLKRILPTDDEDVWELRSDNPAYPPFKIKTEHVRGVWRVLLRMIQ
jgi:phage repressor protein C with HTH and peptisase S24 domain